MDELNIDFDKLLPYIIDGFTKVYGDEYYSIIKEKINDIPIIQFYEYEGFSDYISYVKKCKKRECAIKFLNEIGIDITKYKKENYTEDFDYEINDVLKNYINSMELGFSTSCNFFAPLKAFDKDNDASQNRILRNKLRLINHLINDENRIISEDNFLDFSKTDEYFKIQKRIEEINEIYSEILSQYFKWETKLELYQKYILEDKRIKDEILQKKKVEIYNDVFVLLPEIVRKIVLTKEEKEQYNCLFGSGDISSETVIEYFHSKWIKKLYSDDVSFIEKDNITNYQSRYLKKIGINVPNDGIIDYRFEENLINYLNFLNQDNIKKYLPSDNLIDFISSIRVKKYEELQEEYYKIKNIKGLDNYAIYNIIKDKKTCVLIDKNKPIMFFTIRKNDGGLLFYNFVHEIGHVIDSNSNGCGFEFVKSLSEKNPYDFSFRKYERFNETLTDIFAMEVISYFQNKNIYLIEPKEFTKLNVEEINIPLLVKKLLIPLLSKFRNQVIKAKISADADELIKYIGFDNFEELVDVVNKVDYLCKNNIAYKIKNSPDDEMVIEYYKQLERIKRIYKSIDEYYENNFDQQDEVKKLK